MQCIFIFMFTPPMFSVGPAHTTTSEYSLSMCLGRDVVSRSSGELLDHSSCLKYGKVDNEYGFQDHFDRTVKDMVMMVEIPYRTTEFVFSRWFQYMLVDLDMQFKSDKFVNAIHGMLFVCLFVCYFCWCLLLNMFVYSVIDSKLYFKVM